MDCASYRPISLLNCDVKILAKVLASRLEEVLPTIISPDQTGFIKNRQSFFFNIRLLLNVVYSQHQAIPDCVVSLDAEKAFGRVEWEYLFLALEQFGFGPVFLSWIKLLYNSPSAVVYTLGRLTNKTRQGCPLSPLLFALAFEPLAIALRESRQITGLSLLKNFGRFSGYNFFVLTR